jgi:hypothetical protein
MPSPGEGVLLSARLIVRCKQREAYHRRMTRLALTGPVKSEHETTANLLDDLIKEFTVDR